MGPKWYNMIFATYTYMNIFYLDQDPRTCAQYHADRHVVKMIVEYMQLLSTVHRVLDGVETITKSETGRKKTIWKLDNQLFDSTLYSATHINHPSAKWVRNSASNYLWLVNLVTELLNEYSYRYEKIHACERLLNCINTLPKNINTTLMFEPPWRAMPDEFKINKSIDNYCVESYRAYYNGAKQHIFKWKHREVPYWAILKD